MDKEIYNKNTISKTHQNFQRIIERDLLFE